jgi:hypothetical protein
VSNPSLITERYSIFPAGCIRHNKCRIYLPDDDIISGHISCRTCFNARTHLRKDRDPELFAALDDDVQSQIAPPKSQIENALKMKYRNVSIVGFAEDSEVSWLCKMFRLSYPEVSSVILAEVTATSLFFCQRVDANADCQLFWVASGKKCRTFCGNFCVACQNAQLTATRRQKRREIDKGDRTSTSSKVNTYWNPLTAEHARATYEHD